MYRLADKLLEQLKKLIRREFNRFSIFGFDELNTPRVTKETVELFNRLMEENRKRYLQVARQACIDAKALVLAAGYRDKDVPIPDERWLGAFLGAYNFVSGYLYEPEAERKRLRLSEQILTAKEYQSRTQYNDSLRRTANLWWTQTLHYMLDAVDESTLDTYEFMGVEKVEWHTNIDGRECKTCRDRNGMIYDIDKVPPKAHRNCRCRLTPVPIKK
jgi:SPP1 gp7 family putative phage head morphogenesis protein